jgi:phosphoribosylglycinamide formyltransferase 1
MTRKRVAVLISGRGSNMAALLEAAGVPTYPAEIVLVVSNRPDAAGLPIASGRGVRTAVVDHTEFPDKTAFEAALEAELRAAAVDLVCLAGFMRLLTHDFVESWRDRLINIHPSLLPLFPGLDTHAAALATGVKIHGCTVHFVRTEVDSGPIIAQAAVPVLSGDTPERLAERVLAAEHRIYPLALSLVAGGKARVVGEQVVIDGQDESPGDPLFSPRPV